MTNPPTAPNTSDTPNPPPTIDGIEQLLRAHGLAVERLQGADVLTARMLTKAYKNAKGSCHIDVRIHIDKEHNCLVMTAPGVFDSSKALHKEIMLSLLLGAVSKSPLIRLQYDPSAGDVGFRVDGLLAGGMPREIVVTMLESLPAFADDIYPQLMCVMRPSRPQAPAQPTSTPGQRVADVIRRGGGLNRVAALLRIQQEEERRRREDGGQSANGGGPSVN